MPNPVPEPKSTRQGGKARVLLLSKVYPCPPCILLLFHAFHAACPCCLSPLHVPAESSCCMLMLSVHYAFLCYKHVYAACPFCISISMPHDHAACPYCMSISMLHVLTSRPCCMSSLNVDARPCCIFMLPFHTTCPYCISMLYVHAACSCQCQVSMFYVRAACP